MRSSLLYTVLALTGTFPLEAQAVSPRQLVVAALTQMGGETAARNLATLTIEMASYTLTLGQERTPGVTSAATVRSGMMFSDWVGERSVTLGEFRGQAVNKVRFALWPEGGIAEIDGRFIPAPGTAVQQSRRTLRLAPQRILLAALEPGATMAMLPARAQHGVPLQGIRLTTTLDTVGLWFSGPGHVLHSLETWTDDPILGNRNTLIEFNRWSKATNSALLVPMETIMYVNGRIVSQVSVSSARANEPADTALFSVPDSVKASVTASASTPPGVQVVSITELAPGVLHLAGGSHNSLAITQGDSIVLVEVPLSSERVAAVLDTLAARFPRTPVRLAVNSHHHWDHAGGVRAAFKAKLPVVTAAGNVDFLRSVGKASRTLNPDGVEHGANRHVVRGIRDSLVIGTGVNRVLLYEVPSSHASGLLAAYLPGSRILFIADIAPQATPVQQMELVEFVRGHGLQVERIAPAHGPATPYADFEQKTVAAARQ